jgi:gamma-glutamylcysteine synthetase
LKYVNFSVSDLNDDDHLDFTEYKEYVSDVTQMISEADMMFIDADINESKQVSQVEVTNSEVSIYDFKIADVNP